MNISNSITTSIRNMRRYPLRSSLSILGIVIGIFAVSLTVSLGSAVQDFVIGQLSSFGTDMLVVHAKVPGLSVFGTSSARVQGIEITTLKPEDFTAMMQFPFVEETSSYTTVQEYAVAGNKEKQLLMIAATPSYIQIDQQLIIEEGRFFNEREHLGAEKVIVLGPGAKQTFFGESDAVGQTIRIKSTTFRIIGVLKPRGASFGFNLDDSGYIPLKTGQQELLGVTHVPEGSIRLKKGTNEDEAAAAITEFMRRRHKIVDARKDDFDVMTMSQAIGIAKTVTDVMRFLLVTLAAISLLVGGVGIMNIMLVSVTERLHEIGIRKAFGATYADVFRQFVIESITLTSLGGLIGVVLATLGIVVAGFGLQKAGYAWKLGFPIESILISMAVSATIGLVFGVYPARKASKLSTIEALKVD